VQRFLVGVEFLRNNMKVAQEEVFGPGLCVIPFTSSDEVVHMANESKYGLAAMVWSKDLSKANAVAKQLRCGTVWINTYGAFLNEASFGGYKQSGFGRELGTEGLLEYTQSKHILVDQTPGGKSLVTSWF
jgi:acyl-CoA reductase-like NAD-dependent aldehyde dehydrogenase